MINVSRHIKAALAASEDVARLVGDRVHYLLASKTIQKPFISYEYSLECSPSDKDRMLFDVATVDLYCAADTPDDMLALTDAVRSALDGLQDDHIDNCVLSSVTIEVTQDGLFVSRSVYTLTTTKK